MHKKKKQEATMLHSAEVAGPIQEQGCKRKATQVERIPQPRFWVVEVGVAAVPTQVVEPLAVAVVQLLEVVEPLEVAVVGVGFAQHDNLHER